MSLRVLHVVETWRPVSSGYTSRGWHIVNAQLEAGACVPFVIVSSRQALHGVGTADMPVSALASSVRIAVSHGREQAVRRLRPFHTSVGALAEQIATACNDWQIDVIHCHWASGIGAAARRAADHAGVALVGEIRFDLAGATMSETVRCPVPGLETLLRRRFDRFLRGADAIVAASHSLGRLVDRSQPGVAGSVAVMPNAVDCERFRPGIDVAALRAELGLTDAFVVGSTTNMLRYEGLDVLLDAVAHLNERVPNLHVLLVGHGTQHDSLMRKALAADLPVTFVGRVPADAVPAYLNVFDLFVVPRRDAAVTRHASPIKLVEAQACGVPAIGSALGDIPDILASGGGLSIAPDDAELLASTICDISGDTAWRESAARRARAWALAQPKWSALAHRYAALYAQALNNRASPR